MPHYPFNRLFTLYYFSFFHFLCFSLPPHKRQGFSFFNHTLSFSPILTRT
nr:MAG TPA: hypothetical protein [Caudoviricetes sp.]